MQGFCRSHSIPTLGGSFEESRKLSTDEFVAPLTQLYIQESGVHSPCFAETMIEETGATDEVRDVTGFLYAGTYTVISNTPY